VNPRACRPLLSLIPLLLLPAGCPEPETGGSGGGGGSDIAARCAGLCDLLAAQGCTSDAAGCRTDCTARFSGGDCDGAALLDCYQQGSWADGCALPTECAVQAGNFAACEGATSCIGELICDPSPDGCACTTSCTGYTITAACNPLTGQCSCSVEGPLAPSGPGGITTPCIEEGTTNKWCITQPLGCCLTLFEPPR